MTYFDQQRFHRILLSLPFSDSDLTLASFWLSAFSMSNNISKGEYTLKVPRRTPTLKLDPNMYQQVMMGDGEWDRIRKPLCSTETETEVNIFTYL
jgi:hypothetical protein